MRTENAKIIFICPKRKKCRAHLVQSLSEIEVWLDSRKKLSEQAFASPVLIAVVCRVKRMTCRLESDRGSSVVHPRSLREV